MPPSSSPRRLALRCDLFDCRDLQVTYVSPVSYLTWVLPKLAAAATKPATGLLPHDYAALDRMAVTAHVQGPNRRLWYSAAVGGGLPPLETIATLKSPVREIRGIMNGTCGVVLEAWGQGKTRPDRVTLAQQQGFAEADPIRDLSELDSADKLSLLVLAALGDRIAPEDIRTRGIETIAEPAGHNWLRARSAPWKA